MGFLGGKTERVVDKNPTAPYNPKMKDVEKLIGELTIEEQIQFPLWRLVAGKVLTFNDMATVADLNDVVIAGKMLTIKEGFMIALIPEVQNE